MDMRFSISHETHYRYSAPVRLAAHVLRFTPRADNVVLLAHSLIVDPAPSMRQDLLDRYGNTVTHVDFEGSSDHFRVESVFELETSAAPLVEQGQPTLPWTAADDALSDYLPAEDQHDSVRAFAAELASESGGDVVSFLERLNHTLFTRTNRHIRPTGAAQTPEHTLATGRGACRDLSVLFIGACRSLGIPARFVSGYQAHAQAFDGRRHLHAWAEVHLPDIGWRGFDPMHGLPVLGGHVALCAAPDQAGTMPVEGGFYGDGVTSTLDYEVKIASQPR
jgi:transglutaminase-like putative cysteine protease